MAQEGVYVFPDTATRNSDVANLATIAALSGNGGFGGMNNPLWMMFMYPFILPFINGMYGNGMFGGFGNGGGFVANQLNNDVGRDLIVQAINGRADALGQLAQITNSSIDSIKEGLTIATAKLAEVGGQVGMSALQVLNGIQSGNASLAKQLCDCCCENRLAIANQTNALQSQMAANHAAATLQAAQAEAADQLAVCQQTNTLRSDYSNGTNSILNAIAAQNTMITKEFCDLKERELQDKINTQGDIITQLRGQISNDKQTEAFTTAFNALNEKINILSAKSPNTVPVVYPNLTAVNNTPYGGGFNPWGYGFGGQSYWG